MSGAVGATGNFGGVIFSVVFRYTNYHQGILVSCPAVRDLLAPNAC